MNNLPKIKILETTLRDGSYTINYQFNASETKYISKILDEIGFEYIEIGPGIGFNAKEYSEHPPASSDEEYILAAREVVKHAKIGMFFIPGIGKDENIDMASRNGLDMIRIGTNINEYTKGFKYLNICKNNGIEATCNLMKSYAVNSSEFANIANECYKAGADIIYLVDSAGGMLPEDIEEFINETKSKNPDIRLGFHGHDNLGLAIQNTLKAIQCGVEVVDSSIRGMGRSSGNTVTEKLIFVLKRKGFEVNYDIGKLLDLSDNVILEYLSGKPEKTLDMIYGFSQFHSSFIGVIQKYSEIYNIDPKDLIVEYTKVDKLNIDEKIVERIAESISKKERHIYHFKIENKVLRKSEAAAQIEVLYQELYSLKHKYNRKIFFNISAPYGNDKDKVSPVIHTWENISFANAETNNESQIGIIISKFRDLVDGFLLDLRIGRLKFDFMNKDYYYSDSELFTRSINNYIIAIGNNQTYKVKNIFIDEREEIYDSFIYHYSKRYTLVEDLNDADLAILGNNYYSYKDFENAKSLKWVIISKPGCIETNLSNTVKKVNFIRVDLSREIFTEIIEKVSYSNLISNEYGIIRIGDELYCSGGYVGAKGTIVVDNINDIRHKFGSSNGDGSINYY